MIAALAVARWVDCYSRALPRRPRPHLTKGPPRITLEAPRLRLRAAARPEPLIDVSRVGCAVAEDTHPLSRAGRRLKENAADHVATALREPVARFAQAPLGRVADNRPCASEER